jgi:hypothetical protein
VIGFRPRLAATRLENAVRSGEVAVSHHGRTGIRMRRISACLVAVSVLAGAGVAHAEPGGCLKYGAAGGVAGHFAGHHTVLGAVGGCAVGAYRRHEYRKHERAVERDRMQHARRDEDSR